MAQVVTSDAGLLTILKTWYTDDKLEQLFWRNSPTARKIKKQRIGGRNYNFAMMHRFGGGASASYTVAVTNAATQAGNAEMSVGPGKIFSVFNINQLEKFASQEKRGAYIPMVVDKMFAATEAWRKQFAAALFGSGYGEFGQVPAGGLIAGVSVIILPFDAIAKIDIGTRFEVTNGDYPADALHAGGPHTVTAIDGQNVTFTPVIPGGGWAAADWLCFEGGRDAGGNPNYPTGLAGWLPSYDQRTGAGWTGYIGTAFYGVNRSISVDRLAGNFCLRDSGGGETRAEALVRALGIARRAGSKADIIVLNTDDWQDIAADFGTNAQLMQFVNSTPENKSGNVLQNGLSDMGFQFSTSWIQFVYEDPYCPVGKAYILDSASLKFVGLSNPSALDDGIAGNNPGVQMPEDGPGINVDDYRFVIDDYLTVQPGADAADGPAARVSLSLYGNFVCNAPGHNCVVDFDI